MSLFDWFHDFCYSSDDPRVRRIAELHEQASRCSDHSPAEAIAHLKTARDLAVQLDAPRVALFCDHWILQYQMLNWGNADEILERAVAATVQARHSSFADLPQRVCLHEDLIYAYIAIDPLGYATQIESAMEYMKTEIAGDVECRGCWLSYLTRYESKCGRWNDAGKTAAVHLKEYNRNSYVHQYQQSLAYENLCSIDLANRDWESLLGHAVVGLQRANSGHRPVAARSMHASHAVALLALNRAQDAKLAVVRATRRPHYYGVPGLYYDALSEYYHMTRDLTEALVVRAEQLSKLVGKSRPWEECLCRIERCRLLKEIGDESGLASELAEVRKASEHLKDPRVLERQLADLHEGT